MTPLAGAILALAIATGAPGGPPPVSHQERAEQVAILAIAANAPLPAAFLRGMARYGWQYRDPGRIAGRLFTGIVWACGPETCYAGQTIAPGGAKALVTGP